MNETTAADKPIAEYTDEELAAAHARNRRTARRDRLGPTARIRPVSSFNREEIAWLWPDRIARRKLTFIVGDPGLGKSLATVDLAARVSTGWPFPDGSHCEPADVILANAEDDPGDTIRPRIEAAKADLERVQILSEIIVAGDNGTPQTRPFTLADIEAVEDALDQIEEEGRRAAAVVIDPVSAFIAGIDSHKNTEVRAMLRPWSDLASKRNVAVICVSHLNKGAGANAIYRVTGSLAFTAAARAVWAVVRDPEDDRRRLFLPVKNNIGPDRGGLAYTVADDETGVPYVDWEDGAVETDVNAVMAADGDEEERSARTEAVDWLRSVLSDGPMLVRDLQRESKDAGLSWRTVKRAKAQAGILSRKSGYRGPWEWFIPEAEGPKDTQGGQEGQESPSGTLGTLGTLGGDTDEADEDGDSLYPEDIF